MTRSELVHQTRQKNSYLCIGLDTDINRIPKHLLQHHDPIFEFNKQIIDATKDLCVAYKPNIAFYEALGAKGWYSLQKTLDYIPHDIFTIADAKRGDIGNTSSLYAKAFFETMDFDAVTVTPYMGIDSVAPFLAFEDKWVILLALTSNKGSQDFQLSPQENGEPLFEKVMRKAMTWGSPENLMYVVGATHPEKMQEIRKIAPDHFLLVPGVGAQGGDLTNLSAYGLNHDTGLLVNSSRGIIYAGGDSEDFAAQARNAALALQQEMQKELTTYNYGF
ncbi:MAG TPA: orotidine-5'-phosphate decarboxylase [Phaeodactylibacter sp.]|nr:orotidine-5'-phosphate decarboxylase [Phaeodactylibacter sp.]